MNEEQLASQAEDPAFLSRLRTDIATMGDGAALRVMELRLGSADRARELWDAWRVEDEERAVREAHERKLQAARQEAERLGQIAEGATGAASAAMVHADELGRAAEKAVQAAEDAQAEVARLEGEEAKPSAQE